MWRTLAAISLILLVGAVVVWVRSYWVADYLTVHRYPDLQVDRRPQVYELRSWRGESLYTFIRFDDYEDGGEPGFSSRKTDYDGRIIFFSDNSPAQWLGFGAVAKHFRASAGTSGGETPDFTIVVSFPIWSVALLFSIAPAFWFTGMWKRTRGIKQSRVGLCTGCGYDLRASSGVCPECGRSIDANPKVAQSTWIKELRPLAFAAIALAIVGGVVIVAARTSFERQKTQLAQFKELKSAFADRDKGRIESLLKAGAPSDPQELAYVMCESIGWDERFAFLMLDFGADLSSHGHPVLIQALEADRLALAQRLIEKGAPLNDVSEDGGTALLMLAGKLESDEPENPKLKLAELMLARGADPKLADKTGVTPLHALALVKSGKAAPDTVRLAQMLLDHGAQINARDISDETPLHWANFHGREALAAFLILKGGKE